MVRTNATLTFCFTIDSYLFIVFQLLSDQSNGLGVSPQFLRLTESRRRDFALRRQLASNDGMGRLSDLRSFYSFSSEISSVTSSRQLLHQKSLPPNVVAVTELVSPRVQTRVQKQ